MNHISPTSPTPLNLFEQALLDNLQKLNATQNLVVAFSGGLDSKSLLHALVQLRAFDLIQNLKAIHVNHGLQLIADQWLIQCQQDCLNYQVELLTIKLTPTETTNIEANARQGRYDFFESVIQIEQNLVMAHHQDDQAETLLFRLLRGCGIDGAAAMPKARTIGQGRLVRPLLNITRNEIEHYAKQNNLSWIEDPTNACDDYSRNFLRNKILTQLKIKWPSYVKTLARFSELANDQNQLLVEVAEQDLQATQTNLNQLNIQKFNLLSPARQKNLLHFWGKKQFRLPPSFTEINQVLNQIQAAEQQAIKVRFSKGWLRSFNQCLLLCPIEDPNPINQSLAWKNINTPLDLNNGILLATTKITDVGLRRPQENEIVIIKARVGGEKCLPDYRHKSTELKKIYQELNIPPWQRIWLPIVYYNQSIVAIPGVLVDKHFLTQKGEDALQFKLEFKDDCYKIQTSN